MKILNFKKGLEGNLPNLEQRDENTFYITEDGKKMYLGDIVWEDTESVKADVQEMINNAIINVLNTEL